MSKRKTYFYITPDGVYRRDIDKSDHIWLNGSMKLAMQSNIIIEMSEFGRGKTVKNRDNADKVRYFTKDEMVIISLQAEKI